MKPLQAVIMAAGKGTRMGNPDMPKVLTPLSEKPIIHHLLENLSDPVLSETLDSVVLVVGHHAEKVKSAVEGDNYFFAHQAEQLGSAHAVLSAKEKVVAPYFIALNGDSPFVQAESVLRLLKTHQENNAKISTFTVTVPNFEKQYAAFANFGRIMREDQGEFIAIKEVWDCNDEEKQIKELSTNIFLFDSQWAFENLAKIDNNNKKQEYYLTGIVDIAIHQGEKVHTAPIHPYEVYGVNTPEDLLNAEELIIKELNKNKEAMSS